MNQFAFIDVAPDPVSTGIVLAVILFVAAFVCLLVAALVVFLWYRKRNLRRVEMIRSEEAPSPAGIDPIQPNNPNQS